MIFIIFNFTPKDEHNFIIADLKTPDQKEQPNKLYSTKFTGADSLTELLLKAQELKAEGYIIMLNNIHKAERLGEPFTIEKHFDILQKALNDVKEQSENKPLMRELETIAIQTDPMKIDTRKIFLSLKGLMKKFLPLFSELPEQFNPETDRDYLDLSIEMTKLLYCTVYNYDYKNSEEVAELLYDKPLMDLLLRYKGDYYGQQIFGEYGFNIIERMENGDIKIAAKEPEEKGILN